MHFAQSLNPLLRRTLRRAQHTRAGVAVGCSRSMLAVLALSTAAHGAVLTAAALDSAAAAVASAASTVIINGDGPYEQFWSDIPSTPSSYTVAAGTALSFRYTSGHNVWLLPTEEAFNACDFSAATELASQTYGGGQAPIWPNNYQAVATTAGDLLIACQAVMASHCGRGQKIRLTVTERPPPSPPPPPPTLPALPAPSTLSLSPPSTPPTPLLASPSPLTPDGEESGAPPRAQPVGLAASLGAAAAAYLGLRHAAAIRGGQAHGLVREYLIGDTVKIKIRR